MRDILKDIRFWMKVTEFVRMEIRLTLSTAVTVCSILQVTPCIRMKSHRYLTRQAAVFVHAGPSFVPRQRQKMFLFFSKPSRTVLEPTPHPINWVPVYFAGIKIAEAWGDNSHLPGTDSTPPVCHYGMHKHKYPLLLLLLFICTNKYTHIHTHTHTYIYI